MYIWIGRCICIGIDRCIPRGIDTHTYIYIYIYIYFNINMVCWLVILFYGVSTLFRSFKDECEVPLHGHCS